MNEFFRIKQAVGIAAATMTAVTAAMGAGVIMGSPVAARAQESSTVPNGITVQGTGDVKVTPDIARLTLGVQTQDADSQKASQDNARQTDALIKAIRSLGVAEKDLQTSGFSINPQYEYRDNKPPRVVGYQVSNSVTVTIRKIADTGRVIDGAVKAGANVAGGIEFDLNDDAKLKARDEALTRAVADAYRKTWVIASAANVRLVYLIRIVEGGGDYRPPVRPLAMMKSAAAEVSTPVAPGEQTISASVSVCYAIFPLLKPTKK